MKDGAGSAAVELPLEAARLLDTFHGGGFPHLQKMAAYLLDVARMERLERFRSSGTLPTRAIHLGLRALELFDDSTIMFLGRLKRNGYSVSCRPGCTHCCYNMPVGVSSWELILIYARLQGSGAVDRCFRRALRAMERVEEIRRERPFDRKSLGRRGRVAILRDYLRSETACPFLENDRCQVYSVRPLACRVHFSLTPRHWCDPGHFQNAHAIPFNVEPGEAVEEALDRIDGRLALGLPDALASGFLGLLVNVLRFRKIELTE